MIDRHAGSGEEARDRGDVDNIAALARKAVEEAQRKVCQRAGIEVDHRALLGAVEARGRAEQAEARVVDDVLRFEAARQKFVRQPVGRTRLGKIDRDRVRSRAAGRRDRIGDGGKLGGAARNQHDFVAMPGEHARERRADPRRRARDQGNGL
jgi:hypothetical protein